MNNRSRGSFKIEEPHASGLRNVGFRGETGPSSGEPKSTLMTDTVEKGLVICGEQ